MAALADITWVFIAIISLFYVGLLVKPFIKTRVCIICLAVSLTWLTLLVLRAAEIFDNNLIIALLLGQSVVGGYYLWERHTREDWLIFRLPVLLALTFTAWTLISMKIELSLLVIVALVWILHGLLYNYRKNPQLKGYVAKIIACCSRW